MTILATVTSQRQLNIPSSAMQFLPNLKTPGKVLLSFNENRMIVEPVPDFLEFVAANRPVNQKHESIKKIMAREKKAIEDARMERFLAKKT